MKRLIIIAFIGLAAVLLGAVADGSATVAEETDATVPGAEWQVPSVSPTASSACPPGVSIEELFDARWEELKARNTVEHAPTTTLGWPGRLAAVLIWGDKAVDLFHAEKAWAMHEDCVERLFRQQTNSSLSDIFGFTENLGMTINDRADAIDAALSNLMTTAGGIEAALSAHDANLTARADAIDAALSAHDTNLTARADAIDAALSAHDANLTARADAIDAAIADFRGENLGQYIEENLASCTSLVSLYLPAANGGRLETVRDLVDEWITQSENAGLKLGKARSFHDSAVDDIGSGAYKQAYSNLCKAYSHLADPGPR